MTVGNLSLESVFNLEPGKEIGRKKGLTLPSERRRKNQDEQPRRDNCQDQGTVVNALNGSNLCGERSRTKKIVQDTEKTK